VALTLFATLLAFNQVVVKVIGGGFGSVFQAGLRSFGAIFVLGLWIWLRGIPLTVPRHVIFWDVVSGVIFAAELTMLFTALDLTTVPRLSIVFYSMPVWLALASHVLLPGEALTGVRLIGLGLWPWRVLSWRLPNAGPGQGASSETFWPSARHSHGRGSCWFCG